jgi:hypothetical protein
MTATGAAVTRVVSTSRMRRRTTRTSLAAVIAG